MSYRGSDKSGAWRSDGGVQPDAFDPLTQPELFRGVAIRRAFAFLIDLVVIAVPVILGYLFIAVFGLLTLGLGWALFLLAWPASVLWAIFYYGVSIGGPHSATVGMRMMDLELRTWHDAPQYFPLDLVQDLLDWVRDALGERAYAFFFGALYATLFWLFFSLLTPFVVLVGLFNGRRRLLHDFALGTVVINSSVRSEVPQPARSY